jgi:hypothetical protein
MRRIVDMKIKSIPTRLPDRNFNRGSNAAMQRKPRTANPFKIGSAAWTIWNAGYDKWASTDWQAEVNKCREQLAAGQWQQWVADKITNV